METLIQDLKYGARTLLKNPGFFFVAALALALGIGANTAIFTLVNALLLKPLPYRNAEQLVLIWHRYPKLKLDEASISPPSYVEYRDMTSSFQNVATGTSWSVNLTGVGEPERLDGARVSYNLFTTLGVEPAMGRAFTEDEDQPGKNNVVIISHGLWKRRFGGDPAIINQTIALDGESHTVIGVLPPAFVFMQQADVFKPIAFTSEQLAPNNHGFEYLVVVARLKPETTVAAARAEMDTLADRLRPEFYGNNSDWGITVNPLREQLVGNFRLALLVLLGAVTCVLLIACANVANLLLARASSRQKEVAIRTALGAGRLRIARQLLTESILLGVFGGVIGLGLAYVGIRALVAGVPEDITGFVVGWKQIGINIEVLGFTLGLSLLTGTIFGLAPAIQASRTDLNKSLKEGGRSGSEGASRNLVRSILVVVEVAIAVVLLVGAGLLIKSFVRLQEVTPGFDASGILTMQIALPETRYKEREQISSFFEQVLQRISATPGVESAAVANGLPMSGNNWNASFAIEGLQVQPGEPSPHGDPHMISPDYFKTMRIPLLRGRYFTDADTKNSKPVCIIDQTLADQYWPEQDPVGKRIAAFFDAKRGEPLNWREVIGVVGHVKQYGLDGKSKVQYYFPQTQRPVSEQSLVVRTSSDPALLTNAVKSAISQVDPDQPVYKVTTMEKVVAGSTLQKRFSMYLLGIFSSVALLLAAVGIYGVMSYSVSQRTHEIGIRMALGARSSGVLGMIVRQGLIVTGIGVGAGLFLAFLATKVMESLLFAVGVHDPVTFVAIPVVLVAVSLLACLLPARRATKVDPMIALRYE